MAWQGFRYSYLHAARDAGASGISGQNSFATTGPKDFLIDDRAGSLCTFASTADDHHIQIDRGSGSLEAIDRMIIPAGHNLDGLTVRLRSSSTSDFSSDVDVLVDSITAAAGLIDEDLDVSSTDRYVRLDFPGETGINPEIGELIPTRIMTPVRGPEPGWDGYPRHNTLDFEKESGVVASLALGSDRDYYRVTYRDLTDSADISLFEDLATTCGTSKPFWLDPPWDSEAALWVKLMDNITKTSERAAPGSASKAHLQLVLEMLEHLA